MGGGQGEGVAGAGLVASELELVLIQEGKQVRTPRVGLPPVLGSSRRPRSPSLFPPSTSTSQLHPLFLSLPRRLLRMRSVFAAAVAVSGCYIPFIPALWFQMLTDVFDLARQLSAVAASSAKQIVITVGGNTTNNASAVFQPAEVTANIGDVVFFNCE